MIDYLIHSDVRANILIYIPMTADAHRCRLDKGYLERGAQHAADCANDPVVPPSVKWTFVGDYVEQVARWAMSDPER
jgi:hypothetical protein